MAEALAVVKVGNRECEFLKLTPLSRTSAIAGAVCGVTIRPRKPSGTNRMRFLGVSFCADAIPADRTVRPADNRMIARRIKNPPGEGKSRPTGLSLFLFFLYDEFFTPTPACQFGGWPRLKGCK